MGCGAIRSERSRNNSWCLVVSIPTNSAPFHRITEEFERKQPICQLLLVVSGNIQSYPLPSAADDSLLFFFNSFFFCSRTIRWKILWNLFRLWSIWCAFSLKYWWIVILAADCRIRVMRSLMPFTHRHGWTAMRSANVSYAFWWSAAGARWPFMLAAFLNCRCRHFLGWSDNNLCF